MAHFKKMRLVELIERECVPKIETKTSEISKEPAKAMIKVLILYSSRDSRLIHCKANQQQGRISQNSY